jgi:pimeloyl-ACP methyl ester carboxylesterase
VVAFADTHFRTIRSPGARGLAGHGVGGTGALELALKHPDIFSSVYAMSPALFDPNGLQDAGALSRTINSSWASHLDQWRDMDEPGRRKGFRDYIHASLNSPSRGRFMEGLFISYAAAVSPDLSLPYPHIALPAPGSADETNIKRHFEQGLGGWEEKLSAYANAGRSLKAITLEYTASDEYQWIRRGTEYVSRLMSSRGIMNKLETHEGGHDSTLGRRLKTAMLPSISNSLQQN